jgi:hypothetical protein
MAADMAYTQEFEYDVGQIVILEPFGKKAVMDTVAKDVMGTLYGVKTDDGHFLWVRFLEIRGLAPAQ